MSTNIVVGTPQQKALNPVAGTFLTFSLGLATFGIPVLQVREIIRHTRITVVPQMPDHVKGVLNLRGKVVPILDLRLKFKLTHAELAERTCIIVVQVQMRNTERAEMGLIVDGVESVTNIPPGDIDPAPEFGSARCSDYISGMAKQGERVVTLLDIARVVGSDLPLADGVGPVDVVPV
jgi:purine-binding chemotaxis protein CheW